MSISIPQINAAADTFDVWLSRTNLVLNAVSTVVMTVNSSASGDVTTGNGSVNGVFGATVLVTPTLRGGNVATANILTIASNVVIGNSSFLSVGNTSVNATLNSTMLTIATVNVGSVLATNGSFSAGINLVNSSIVPVSTLVTTNSVFVIDSTALTTRASEYLLAARDNNANAYQVSKILLIQDGGSASITEYAIETTNGSIGVFSGSVNSTAMILSFTSASSNNVTIKGTRNSIGL